MHRWVHWYQTAPTALAQLLILLSVIAPTVLQQASTFVPVTIVFLSPLDACWASGTCPSSCAVVVRNSWSGCFHAGSDSGLVQIGPKLQHSARDLLKARY